jgi:ABC-2 type transport system permease protein
MAADTTAPTQAVAPSGLSRFYGFGSVFAKTIRDSRRATIIVTAVLAFLLILVSAAVASAFSTPESRAELAAVIAAVPPILQGLAGKPVNVDSLGGYVNYKYGTFFPLIVSLWSILALSGTLAAETRRGSMEFLAATGLSRRRISIEKLFAHILALTITCLVVFVALLLVDAGFATMPQDEITVEMAAGYATWLGLLSLAAGALAWAIAPFLGRGAAVGIAGTVTFAGFFINGYQAAIPDLAPFANLSWFGWTTDHLPLAGQFDWASLLPVVVAIAVLLVIGVEAFARRDLGSIGAIPLPSLPRALMGVEGPTGRAASEQLSTAVSWGVGLGFFGLVLAGSGSSFLQALNEAPDFLRLLETVFPGADVASAGGFLQLVFVEFGLVLAGLAAATLVGRWASDETSGRLEMVLATPLSRARWVVSGWLGSLASIALIIVLTMVGIAIGATITGGDIATPILGTLVLGIYAAGLAGVGFAAGGLFRTSIAAPTVAILTIVTWFFQIVAPALDLPEILQELALSSHFGEPMLGRWDPVGIVACTALAIAGVAFGAWGLRRRDLRS